MTTAHKAMVAVAITLALLLMVGSVTATYLVMSEKMATAIAGAHSEERTKQIDALESDKAKRDQEFKDYKSKAEARLAQVKTPHDVSNAVKQPVGLGGLSFNPFRTYTQATPDGKTHEVTDVPPENIVPLYKQLGACDLREKELGKCVTDYNGEHDKFVLMQKDRDQWKQVAHGGSKARRFFRFAIPLACAGGTAYVARKADAPAGITALSTSVAGVGCGMILKF